MFCAEKKCRSHKINLASSSYLVRVLQYARCAGVVLAAVVILTSANSMAWAQGVKDQRRVSPRELIPAPVVSTSAEQQPVDAFIAEDGEEPASVAGEDEERPQPVTIAPSAPITVSSASNISLDTLGLYDEKSGGVRFDVWDGTSYQRARLLLENLPQRIDSPIIRKEVARLLLSSTRPPQAENIQQHVFYPRVEALFYLDEAAQAQRLIDSVPQNLRNERITRLQYTARLLTGDVAWVCDTVADALGRYPVTDGFWQKLSIFCHARAGDEAKAILALDLLAEQNIRLDAGFHALVDLMTGRSKKLSSRYNAPLSLEDAAIIALSGKDAFPEKYLQTAPLPIARLVAGNKEFADYLREQAEQSQAVAGMNVKSDHTRTAMREWFGRQFMQPRERSIDYDRMLAEMRERGGKAEPQLDKRRDHRLHTVLLALGYGNVRTATPWQDAYFVDTARTQISPALRAAMFNAAEDGREAEAILMLGMVGGAAGGFADVDDDGIANMIELLHLLEHVQSARALAVEAMLALY